MLQVIIYAVVGVAVVAALIAVFVRTGAREAASNPRRAEALLVERSGDPALINLYYKARSDAERAEIAGFARSAQPTPAAEETEPPAEQDPYGGYADEDPVQEKKPGLFEKRRAKAEAKAAAAAAAVPAAETVRVTVHGAGAADEKYDDFQSAIAAALRKIEAATTEPEDEVPAPQPPAARAVEAQAPVAVTEAEGSLYQPTEALYVGAPPSAPEPRGAEALSEPGRSERPSAPGAAPPEGRTAAGGRSLCTYCGAELESGCKFCIICGMPAQDMEALAPAAAAPASRPAAVPEPAPPLPPELDPFADRSAFTANRPTAGPGAEEGEPAAAAPERDGRDAPGPAKADLPPVYSLEEILQNVRQLEKRINREEDGGIGYHDAE